MSSGFFALAGMCVAHYLQRLHVLSDREYEARMLLRQKYEEMAFYFGESLLWLDRLYVANKTEDILVLSQDPARQKAMDMCLLYFPDLFDPLSKYGETAFALYEFVRDTYQPGSLENAKACVDANVQGLALFKELNHRRLVAHNAIDVTAKKYLVLKPPETCFSKIKAKVVQNLCRR